MLRTQRMLINTALIREKIAKYDNNKGMLKRYVVSEWPLISNLKNFLKALDLTADRLLTPQEYFNLFNILDF